MYNRDGKTLRLMSNLPQKVLVNKSDASLLVAPILPGALTELYATGYFYTVLQFLACMWFFWC
jgi:hypothetical protein